MFKKTALCFLLAFFALSATAQADWWADAAKPYQGKTLYLMLPTHTSVDSTKPFLDEFTKRTGIKISIEQMQRRTMNTKLEMELSQNEGAYDLVHNSPAKNARYVRAKWVLPLNDFIANPKLTNPDFDYADFAPAFIQAMSVKDQVYAIPFASESTIFYYRTDIYEKYGIKAPPKTIAELRQISQTLKDKGCDIPVYCTRAMQGNGINVFTWCSFLKAYGGDYFDKDMNPVLDSPEAIAATQEYADLIKDFGPPGGSGYNHFDLTGDFTQGKLVQMIGASSWGVSTFANPEKSKVVGKWKAAVYPAGPKGHKPTIYCHALSIPKNAPNQEAAWLLIQWFTSKQVFLDRALSTAGDGNIPRKSVVNNPKFKGKYSFGEWAEAVGANMTYAGEQRPVWMPEWLEVGDAIGAAVQKVISGDASAKEAMTQVNQDVRKMLKEAGYIK